MFVPNGRRFLASRARRWTLVQDEARGPTTRAGRAVECVESCYSATVAESVPPAGRGSGFIDEPRASCLVQSSHARWMVVRRGARKMFVMLMGDM